MFVTWIIHVCKLTHSYEGALLKQSVVARYYMCVTSLIHLRKMNRVFVTCESCHTQVTLGCNRLVQQRTLMWISHVTHMNDSCHTHEWLRSHTCHTRLQRIGSTKHLHFIYFLSTDPHSKALRNDRMCSCTARCTPRLCSWTACFTHGISSCTACCTRINAVQEHILCMCTCSVIVRM